MYDEHVGKIVFGAILLAVLLTIGLARCCAVVTLPGQIARIEQLRVDVERVDVGSNEDVIGQVVACNQQIKENQAYRKVWWGRIVIPPGWEDVKIIEIP